MIRPMRVVVREKDDTRIQVLQVWILGEWFDIDSEVVPNWATIQAATLGSTEWVSKFKNWIK